MYIKKYGMMITGPIRLPGVVQMSLDMFKQSPIFKMGLGRLPGVVQMSLDMFK